MPSYEQIIEPHHRLMFRDNVVMASQQMEDPIYNAVTVVPGEGNAVNAADYFGKVEATDAEEHSRTNPDNPVPRDRRWITYPVGIDSGELITKDAMFKSAMNPAGPLMKAHTYAVIRKRQQRILGVRRTVAGTFEISGQGLFGKVSNGQLVGGSTADLPAGNFIAHNAAGGTTGLNTEKLRLATEAMELADFGFETDLNVFCAIGPKQKTDLLNLALATKTVLNQFQLQQIETGKPTTLLGITWIPCKQLPVDENGYRLCPLWTKENVVAAEWQGIEGRIFNDPHQRELPQILIDAYIAATRIKDEGIRVIRCQEA